MKSFVTLETIYLGGLCYQADTQMKSFVTLGTVFFGEVPFSLFFITTYFIFYRKQ